MNKQLRSGSAMNKIIIGVLAFLVLSSTAHASKTYRLMGNPVLGSKMKPVEVVSPIPLNKPYSKMKQEHQAIFRANYSVLKDTEQPPFPKKGLRAIYKPMIKGRVNIEQGGTLFLVAMISENGKVETVTVYETPSEYITKLANTVLLDTEFEPALCSGEPCKMEFPFEYKMPDRFIKAGNGAN